MRQPGARTSAAGALVALMLTLCGCGGAHSHSPVAGASASRLLQPQGSHGPRVAPALARLELTLGRAFGRAGASSGATVYDLATGGTLFALRPGVKRPPASLEKLYTSVALLAQLGPEARLRTSVLGVGHLTPRGIWKGDLYLRGGGDPTFGDGTFNQVWEGGYGPTAAAFARRLAALGIRQVSGKLIGDASLFDDARGGPATAMAPDLPDFGGQLSALTYDHGAIAGNLSPGAFAARQLALTLRSARIRAFAAGRTARTPRRARLLASFSSPPLSVLVQLMNVPSDDLFAEMLTKQLGVRFDHAGTIAAGAHVITGTIAAYGLHPRILDGSGLSRDDRSSPAEIVALLRTVWRTWIGHVLSASLPVVGMGGTVRNLAQHTAAQGRCIAKTGTLNNVTNLAGYCRSRRGDVIAFALLLDGLPNDRALRLLGHMVSAIAQY